jgi:hypothetical protein
VTLTDRSGATGSREASYTPPLPKDPASLTAAVQSDGSVLLSWPPVAGVTRYQVSVNKGMSAPVIVDSVTWHSVRMPAISQRWTVNSVYEPGGSMNAAATWPSASTTVALPTPNKMFLTQPAGVGNYADSVAHARTKCSDAIMPGSLCKAAGILGAATNWEGAWNDAGAGQSWPAARFDNNLDLGTARRVNCTPRKNGSTVCWAAKHSQVQSPNDPHALTLIIMGDDNKAFYGNWEYDGDRLPDDKNLLTRGGWTGNWLDHEHAFAMAAELRTGAALDTQGVKQVPHACLSCHGGTYDPVSKMVTGSSLLPIVPARVIWRSGSNRNDEEESIRRINYIVLQSNPAPAIVAQINTMYNGRPHSVDQPANDAAIPPGWQSQPDLYRKVIQPYCSGCHYANRGVLSFRDFANLQQNKAAIQNSVCRTFTMPHSEILFKKFWTEQDGDKLLPDLLMNALGMGSCR